MSSRTPSPSTLILTSVSTNTLDYFFFLTPDDGRFKCLVHSYWFTMFPPLGIQKKFERGRLDHKCANLKIKLRTSCYQISFFRGKAMIIG